MSRLTFENQNVEETLYNLYMCFLKIETQRPLLFLPVICAKQYNRWNPPCCQFGHLLYVAGAHILSKNRGIYANGTCSQQGKSQAGYQQPHHHWNDCFWLGRWDVPCTCCILPTTPHTQLQLEGRLVIQKHGAVVPRYKFYTQSYQEWKHVLLMQYVYTWVFWYGGSH
jgi:hypothetical protein